MAVVSRKRARKTVLYVVTYWNGRQHWERCQSGDRRDAERLDAKRKDEVRSKIYTPPKSGARSTVARYAAGWIKARKNRSADNDSYCMDIALSDKTFAELQLDAVRPRHVHALIDALKAADRWSPKTITNALGVVKTMFRDAVIEEDIPSNPCVIPRGKLSRRPAKQRTAYTQSEVELLLGRSGVQRRAFVALAICTGMRAGEICGRRWRDWDRSTAPLTALLCNSQYDGAPLKGDDGERARPRTIPVHPVLEAVLRWWWAEGWELVNRRRPMPDDWIVPSSRGVEQCYTKSGATKLWALACKDAGVTSRSLHSTRHTFITFARRASGRTDLVESITHNAAGATIDQYNHFEWEPRCAVVASVVYTPVGVGGFIAAGINVPCIPAPTPGLEPGGSRVTDGDPGNGWTLASFLDHIDERRIAGDGANLAAGNEDLGPIGFDSARNADLTVQAALDPPRSIERSCQPTTTIPPRPSRPEPSQAQDAPGSACDVIHRETSAAVPGPAAGRTAQVVEAPHSPGVRAVTGPNGDYARERGSAGGAEDRGSIPRGSTGKRGQQRDSRERPAFGLDRSADAATREDAEPGQSLARSIATPLTDRSVSIPRDDAEDFAASVAEHRARADAALELRLSAGRARVAGLPAVVRVCLARRGAA